VIKCEHNSLTERLSYVVTHQGNILYPVNKDLSELSAVLFLVSSNPALGLRLI